MNRMEIWYVLKLKQNEWKNNLKLEIRWIVYVQKMESTTPWNWVNWIFNLKKKEKNELLLNKGGVWFGMERKILTRLYLWCLWVVRVSGHRACPAVMRFLNFVVMIICLWIALMDSWCHSMRWPVFVTSLSDGPLRQCMGNDIHFYQMSRTFDHYDSRWYVAACTKKMSNFIYSKFIKSHNFQSKFTW